MAKNCPKLCTPPAPLHSRRDSYRISGVWVGGRVVGWLAGRLAGAGRDVCANEPEDPDHPVFPRPNVGVSPHIAGETRGTARKRNAVVTDNIDRLANARELLYRVDGERPT